MTANIKHKVKPRNSENHLSARGSLTIGQVIRGRTRVMGNNEDYSKQRKQQIINVNSRRIFQFAQIDKQLVCRFAGCPLIFTYLHDAAIRKYELRLQNIINFYRVSFGFAPTNCLRRVCIRQSSNFILGK